jgi:metal-dependent hydrolase (beta-lactamase superfamily II)
MHLLHGSTERMRRTIEALRAIALDWIAPKHCTGDAAMAELCTGDAAMAELCMAFRSQYLECHAGQRFTFPKSNNPST